MCVLHLFAGVLETMPGAERPLEDHGEDREGREANLPVQADPLRHRQQGQPTRQPVAGPHHQLLRREGACGVVLRILKKTPEHGSCEFEFSHVFSFVDVIQFDVFSFWCFHFFP